MIERVVRHLLAQSADIDAMSVAETLWLVEHMQATTSADNLIETVGASYTPEDMYANRDRPAADEFTSPMPSEFATSPPSAGDESQPTASSAAGRGRSVGLYGMSGASEDGGRRAVKMQVATGRALSHSLDLARALRPFKRRFPNPARHQLGLEDMVELYAQTNELTPVFVPLPEHWFNVAVVVDQSPSMAVWTEAVAEFVALLRQLGAFRLVEEWHLDPVQPALRSLTGETVPSKRLRDPQQRRLVIVLTDCVAQAWHSPTVWRTVRTWASSTHTALLNPLPPKLWRTTGLNHPAVRLHSTRPGAPNPELRFTRPRFNQDWLPIPVIGLSSASLGQWARTTMTGTSHGCDGVLLPATGRFPSPPGQDTPHNSDLSTAVVLGHDTDRVAEPDSAKLVRSFRMSASPLAWRLAVLFSAQHSLPLGIMRVVQRRLLPHSQVSDLAEVILGGLFQEVDAAELTLSFRHGVVEHLRKHLSTTDYWTLRDAVSDFLNRARTTAGKATVTADHPTGNQPVPDHLRPYADVEPGSLQGLIDLQSQEPAQQQVTSPAGLLNARLAVVPFRGRDDLLDELHGWAGMPGAGVWLCHGPGGQGKTRLAHHLGGQLTARGWSVLWLDPAAPDDGLRALAEIAAPALVVVDYAEARTAKVRALLEVLATRGQASPLKVLLLARTADAWWSELFKAGNHIQNLLDTAQIGALPLLDTTNTARVDTYQAAVTAFADALDRVPALSDHRWTVAAGALATRSLSRTSTAATVLEVQMTALTDLLDTAPVETPSAPGADPVDRLLDHERRYWSQTAHAHNLPPAMEMSTLADTVVATTLLKPTTTTELDHLLTLVPGTADLNRNMRDRVRTWLTHLYPAAEPGAALGLQSDRLAERLVGRQLAEHSPLTVVDALAPHVTPDQAVRLLTVCARAVAHTALGPNPAHALTAICLRYPATLLLPAIHTAARVEQPAPLIAAVHTTITDPTTSIDTLHQLSEALPRPTQALADTAVLIGHTLVQHHRAHPTNIPNADLAKNLHNLALRLSDLSRREEGLAAITEAIDIYRRLAPVNPAIHAAALDQSLDVLAQLQGEGGQPQGVPFTGNVFEPVDAGQDQQVGENDHLDTTHAALWKLLRRWGIDTVDKAREVRHEIEHEVDMLENPVKRATYRPIPGVDHNQLWLILHDTGARPPTGPNKAEEEHRDAARRFVANGARAVRDLVNRLESTFAWFSQPDELKRKGAQRHLARLYVALRTVIELSIDDEHSGNRDPNPGLRKPAHDSEQPSVARVNDYFLGGTATWAVDREFGDNILQRFPQFRDIVVADRLFRNRVVRYLIKRGVRQFLDIGAGVPAEGSTHHVADEVTRDSGLVPDVRVVYVDNEPVTAAHAEILLDSEGDPARHAVVRADLRDPEELWLKALDTQLLDPTEPIALLLIAKLHFLQPNANGNVTEAVARLRELLPIRSYLAISHITDEGIPGELNEKLAELKRMYDESSSSDAIWRSRADIATLLGDFQLVEPGWTWTPQWHPQETEPSVRTVTFRTPNESVIWAGVGKKAT